MYTDVPRAFELCPATVADTSWWMRLDLGREAVSAGADQLPLTVPV